MSVSVRTTAPRAPSPGPGPSPTRGCCGPEAAPSVRGWREPRSRPAPASAFQGYEPLTARRRPGRSGDFGRSLPELGCSQPRGHARGAVPGARPRSSCTPCAPAASCEQWRSARGPPVPGRVPGPRPSRSPGLHLPPPHTRLPPAPPLPEGKRPAQERSLPLWRSGTPHSGGRPSSFRGSGCVCLRLSWGTGSLA